VFQERRRKELDMVIYLVTETARLKHCIYELRRLKHFFLEKTDWVLRFKGMNLDGENVDGIINIQLETGSEAI
jgi:hypothetical protein